MIRAAGIQDVDFIYKFVISEARNGHFSNDHPRVVKNFFFKAGLKRTILKNIFTDIKGNKLPAAVFIYEENGKRLGFFSLILRKKWLTEIWLMGVTEQNREKGVGAQLLCLAENKAREIYYPATHFFVRSYTRSARMIAILEKYGYEKEKSESTKSGVWTK